MLDWRDQEARNETVFRDMNEWTKDALDVRRHPEDPLDPDRPPDAYLCECSDRRCTEPINLTRLEYEAVRAVPVRFAIAIDHENPEIDRVVSENERYAIVEKFFGAGASIARASDPRR